MLNSNVKTTLFLFVVMIIGFPLIQLLTHLEAGLGNLISNPSLITKTFSREDFSRGYMSLNYDAFANMGVGIEIVADRGLSWGWQLLSGVLFFVPRTIWPGKPDASGLVIGNHIIDKYDYHFANLSNPYVSEGYMNFGYLGIIIMAFLLAVACIYFWIWLRSNDYLKRAVAFYFAMHMIFLLRGDFTNGYSYFVGTFIGLYTLPKLIVRIRHLFLNGKVWVAKTV